MAIAVITGYLNDPNKTYEQGVALYNQFGKDILLITIFKSGNGKSNYHRSRLITELEKLNKKLEETPSAPAALSLPVAKNVVVVQQARYSLTDPEWEKAPDEIKDLYVMNGKLKARAEMAFFNCRVVNSDKERLQLSLSILNDRDKINENWQAIKAYHATGEIKKQIEEESEPEIDQMSMAQLAAVIRNFPTYITKDRAKLEGLPEGHKRLKISTRLQIRETQLRLAKRRIENVGTV